MPEALDLSAVQPGAESLTPIPEPVAKPQLPEGHVPPPPPVPQFPCPLPRLTTSQGSLTF